MLVVRSDSDGPNATATTAAAMQSGVCVGGGGRRMLVIIIIKRRVLWKRVKLKKGWTDDKEKEAHTER